MMKVVLAALVALSLNGDAFWAVERAHVHAIGRAGTGLGEPARARGCATKDG